jgi:phospholipid/cholesterol/gamma-HCH transport system substrate-binding protein
VATEAHKFEVGAFVITATVIGVGVAIWLGASRFLEDTQRFTTYYSESVQGLDPGSSVKYRGVPAGRVEGIEIAPDGDLIEVVMALDVKASKELKGDPSMRATLELSGITGLRYIEIDRRSGDALNQSPTLTFKPPYEVIPSARSSFKAIQAALADIYDRFMQFDLPGISSDARSTLQAANQLLRDERIDALMTNAKAASQSANTLAHDLTALTAKFEPVATNATQASAEAKTLLANLNKSVNGKQLGDVIEQINRLTQSTQQFLVALESAVERVNRTAGNLQSLTDEVRGQPSLLLFSQPPAPQRSTDGSGQ